MKIKNNSVLLYMLVLLTVLSGCAKTSDIVSTQDTNNLSVLAEMSTPVQKTQDSADAITDSEILAASPTETSISSELPTAANEISNTPEDTAAPVILDVPEQYQEITGVLQIAFLDVGQGDSIYIRLPNDESILIDAGEYSASESVIKYIKDNNDKGTIDYLIATHPHSDHIGSMAAVIKAFKIKSVWMPNIIHNTKTFENLLDAIEENELLIDTVESGKTLFDYGNLKAECIAPNGSSYNNLNNYSAAVLLTYNDLRFLFMGDAEKESEAEILAAENNISADVLKVGHHGSSTSSTNAFIKTVSPKWAVISCGIGNSYGHPTNQTLATLAEFGIDIKRTDEDGTIIFSSDGVNISCTTYQTEINSRAPTVVPAKASELSTVKEAPEKSQEQSITVYVTTTGKKYHSDGCRYLSQSKILMNLDEAKQKYDPCSVCNPQK